MPKVCFLETEFFKKDLWRYKMIKYAHGYKYEKKNELHVLSLQRKQNEKRGKCIFTAVYSYM